MSPDSLVPVSDPAALGAALNGFLELAPAQRERLRRLSWQRARDEFDIRGTARRYRELYVELTAGS